MNSVRTLEAKFIGDIYRILIINIPNIPKDYFSVHQSTDEEDTKLSFDITFSVRCKVSVRIRRYKYIKYNDITIRSKSKYGGLTEIDKLTNGEGQLYFYAWMDEYEDFLQKWIVVDIDKIRGLLYSAGRKMSNFDGTEFKTYSIDFLKENNAIVAMSE